MAQNIFENIGDVVVMGGKRAYCIAKYSGGVLTRQNCYTVLKNNTVAQNISKQKRFGTENVKKILCVRESRNKIYEYRVTHTF